MNSSNDDDSMRSRAEGARQDTAAWGKKPMSNSTADRIQQQTLQNMKTLYEGKVRVAEDETQRIKDQRRLEAEETEALFEGLLGNVDMLLKFLMQHHGHELPEEILELIADRQEARIEAASSTNTTPGFGVVDLADADVVAHQLPIANIGAVAGSVLGRSAPSSDGQILRRGADGNVVWRDTNFTTPKSLEAVKEQVRRLVTRLKE